MIVQILNIDCMQYMAGISDNHFDLAIVDVPYGIGEDGKSNHSRNKAFGSRSFGDKNSRKTIIQAKKYQDKNWDNEAPGAEYFKELRRVSVNQIIWGANHFIENNAINSKCWIVWDKDNSGDFADCELAWTSFSSAVRKFRYRWNGMLQERMGHDKEERIHPTQKPVALYKWILDKYAKPGDKILDTHLGSGSSAIAAHKLGFDMVGCEIDPDYFKAATKRFKEQTAQQTFF